MATSKVKQTSPSAHQSRVEEAVDTTIAIMDRLDNPDCSQSTPERQKSYDCLTKQFSRVAKLGEGRLYPRPPHMVSTARLIKLAKSLAAERGYQPIFWGNCWVPNSEPNSMTKQELDGSYLGPIARLALYADGSGADRLLHFTGLPFDDNLGQEAGLTQLDMLGWSRVEFMTQHSGSLLNAADHRDFLVWYIMDLIRKVPADQIVLADSYMQVPALGRRLTGFDFRSVVAEVSSYEGQAFFDYTNGQGYDSHGIGLSAGLTSGSGG